MIILEPSESTHHFAMRHIIHVAAIKMRREISFVANKSQPLEFLTFFQVLNQVFFIRSLPPGYGGFFAQVSASKKRCSLKLWAFPRTEPTPSAMR